MIIIGTKAIKDQSIKIGQAVVVQEHGAKLLGMSFTDDLQWNQHINNTISALNSRLFLIMRLKNKLGLNSLKRIADSIYNSKLRYGIHLCGKVRTLDTDPSQTLFDPLQKAQNKLFRLLNESRVSDKINTKSIAVSLNMLSANQINAQVKLTEMWKAMHLPNYPIKLEKKDITSATNHTRSLTRGDLILQGKSEICKSSFTFDASKLWNKAPNNIKDCRTIHQAKKEIRKFVATLPL